MSKPSVQVPQEIEARAAQRHALEQRKRTPYRVPVVSTRLLGRRIREEVQDEAEGWWALPQDQPTDKPAVSKPILQETDVTEEELEQILSPLQAQVVEFD